MSAGDAGMHTVRLLSFPVAVHLRATEAFEGLRREFALIALGAPDADAAPDRLERLIAALTDQFGTMSTGPDRRRDEAIARGDEVIHELVHVVPGQAAAACVALNEMLDEADEFCRRGDVLLSLATPAEAVAFRRWYLGEFTGQIAGLPALPWTEVDQDALVTATRLRGT